MSDRQEPGLTGDERTLLEGWVDYYRATVLHKCARLTPEQLVTRSCPPSDMSLIGLVRHLVEMERAYVHRLAEPGLALHYVTPENENADFDGVTPAAVETDLATFSRTCAKSREITGNLPLDDRLRWRYLYLIKEYARHLGHADLLRERIDGTTGE